MSKSKTDIFDEAEKHERGRTTVARVPEWFVEKLIAKSNELGNFKLSVARVNEIVGYNHDKHRAPAIRKQLNKYYTKLLAENDMFYVGTTDKDTSYVFGVMPKPKTEA
jgi:hypothetical protein